VPDRRKRFFSFLDHPDLPWGLPNFLSCGYLLLIPLVQQLGGEAIPIGVQIKNSGILTATSHDSSGRDVQGESFARGPKLLSIKNYVIEIMT